jgi:hypothetical protein
MRERDENREKRQEVNETDRKTGKREREREER